MGILPDFTTAVPAEQQTINEIDTVAEVKRTYIFDFTSGDFLTNSMNKVIITEDPVEIVKGVVDKSLHDARYKYLIYDANWGNEVNDLLKQDSDFEVLECELKRIYREALIYHPLIDDVTDFAVEQNGESLYCVFAIVTANGVKLEVKEEVKK